MTDNEFKKLRRSDLIEIIYRLQMDMEDLKAENENLHKQLEEMKQEMEHVGSIEHAVEGLSRLFETTNQFLMEKIPQLAENDTKDGREGEVLEQHKNNEDVDEGNE